MGYLIEVAQQSDEDIAVLCLVEDVALHDASAVCQHTLSRLGHPLEVEQQLLVGRHRVVQPGRRAAD